MALPEGHGPHRYYFQLFALGRRLDFGPDTPLKELIHALKAGTLAKGQMVGTFETPGLQTGDAATGVTLDRVDRSGWAGRRDPVWNLIRRPLLAYG